jgi:hypothetical protein
MNANGGSLSINVNDWFAKCDRDLIGLPGNQILLKQQILALVSQFIGTDYVQLINIRFESVADKLTAIFEVAKSPKPVSVKH